MKLELTLRTMITQNIQSDFTELQNKCLLTDEGQPEN